jgi:hypothetical protein
VVFEDEERAHLLPYDGIPYDVPLWKDVTVHPDHHVSVQYALYSAPSTICPPGTELEARCDRDLVKLYKAGALVKVHPRKAKGGRSTDPDDYPPERTTYAMRAPVRVIRQAAAFGPHVGQFAERLLDAPFPWSKLRQAQRLLRLGERYTPERLDAACARALGFDLIDVRRLERILTLALLRPRRVAGDKGFSYRPVRAHLRGIGAVIPTRSDQRRNTASTRYLLVVSLGQGAHSTTASSVCHRRPSHEPDRGSRPGPPAQAPQTWPVAADAARTTRARTRAAPGLHPLPHVAARR